jgi:uncharacterized protein
MIKTMAFLGLTGAGKSSLCNAMFGLKWNTDDAIACTQKVFSHEGIMITELSKDYEKEWRVLDTPGFDESGEADDHHIIENYEAFHSTDIIIWTIQSDTRAFAPDQKAIIKLTEKGEKNPSGRCIIALNQIDRVYPENWDLNNNKPSPEQSSLIPSKVKLVYQRFHKYLPISINSIVPCSAVRSYGLHELVKLINS